MQVNILFFAALSHDLGQDSCVLDLSDNATVVDAIRELTDRFPGLKTHLSHLATAVNHEYVDQEHVLNNGDELALIPPVSGG